jgi:hypothetical protein
MKNVNINEPMTEPFPVRMADFLKNESMDKKRKRWEDMIRSTIPFDWNLDPLETGTVFQTVHEESGVDCLTLAIRGYTGSGRYGETTIRAIEVETTEPEPTRVLQILHDLQKNSR